MTNPAGETLSRRGAAAVGAALLTLLLTGSGLFGIVGSLLVLFAAVPIAYVTLRFGLVSGIAAVVLAAVGQFAQYGASLELLEYLLLFAIPALLIPQLLRSGWSWDRAATLSALAVVALAGVLMTLTVVSKGETLDTLADQYLVEMMQPIRASLSDVSELSAEQRRDVKLFLQGMQAWLHQTYPAILVTGVVTINLLVVWLLALLVGENERPRGGRFAAWRAPEKLIWALIATGFLYLVTGGLLNRILLNLMILVLLAYYIQGLAVVTALFERRQIPVFLRVIGYAMALVMNPLPLIVTGVGVFDLWIDFRQKRIKGT